MGCTDYPILAWAFYLCAIIKDWNSLCTIEKKEKFSSTLVQVYFPYMPLLSIIPITATNSQLAEMTLLPSFVEYIKMFTLSSGATDVRVV